MRGDFYIACAKLVSPLYLEWNTVENMVTGWNVVFEGLGVSELVPLSTL